MIEHKLYKRYDLTDVKAEILHLNEDRELSSSDRLEYFDGLLNLDNYLFCKRYPASSDRTLVYVIQNNKIKYLGFTDEYWIQILTIKDLYDKEEILFLFDRFLISFAPVIRDQRGIEINYLNPSGIQNYKQNFLKKYRLINNEENLKLLQHIPMLEPNLYGKILNSYENLMINYMRYTRSLNVAVEVLRIYTKDGPVSITQYYLVELENEYDNSIPKLPLIYGERHHLEAFIKDMVSIGYVDKTDYNLYDQNSIRLNIHSILPSYTLSDYKEICAFINSDYQYNQYAYKIVVETFQLPKNWDKALQFCKEQLEHPHWKENRYKNYKIKGIDIKIYSDRVVYNDGTDHIFSKENLDYLLAQMGEEYQILSLAGYKVTKYPTKIKIGCTDIERNDILNIISIMDNLK